MTHADEVSQLNQVANKIDDFISVKQAYIRNSNSSEILGRLELANKKHPVTGVPFDEKGLPVFDYHYQMKLEQEDYLKTRQTHFRRVSQDLYEKLQKNPQLIKKFTDEEIEIFKLGTVPERFTWHHHQYGKTLQAVDSEIYKLFTHRGGLSIIKNGGK